MKRLLYAPKAFVFIRSSNLNGRIFNVTSDVVSGQVTRNINDVSSAEVTLRNRFFKWIFFRGQKGDPDNGKSIFLPMDMITIWLQRVSGKPIQVFTGYLDSVPYYQIYPGNCRLTATCTLKRLAYQWFDPGLDFFQNWLKTEGWIFKPDTGEALNVPGLFSGGPDPTATPVLSQKINDGGFAKLLYDFMTTIASWNPNDVFISKLPSDLPKAAAALYKDIESNTETSLKQLEQNLAQVMGINYVPPQTNPDSTTVDPNTDTASVIHSVASYYQVPDIVAIAAALATTSFNANFKSTQDTKPKSLPGYGLYAMSPVQTTTTSAVTLPQTQSTGLTASQPTGLTPSQPTGLPGPTTTLSSTINGVDIDTILGDPAAATAVFARAAFKASFAADGKTRKSYVDGASHDQKKSVFDWISDTLNQNNGGIYLTQSAFDNKWTEALKLAANVAAQGSGANDGNTNPKSGIKFSTISWDSPALTNLLDDTDNRVLKYYQGGADTLAQILYKAKTQSPNLHLTIDPTLVGPKNPNTIYIAGLPDGISKFARSFINDFGADLVAAKWKSSSGATQYLTLRNGVKSDQVETDIPTNCVMIYTTETPNDNPAVQDLTDASIADPSTPSQLSLTDLARFSANAAFAAQFTFPVNYVESHALIGNKALMNDMSCLDAVKQFCGASMRNFMSLPDGRFLAFYPDYFGAHGRKPYWWIHDIEIMEMGIQLNDEALATHVYVVGDSFLGSGEDWLNEVATRGVATITQALILHGFIDPGDTDTDLGRLGDAWQFLLHYGARPHKESAPLIRNSAYEFLLAWQRFMQLWAAQFQTNVSFTFQPEVMAGGIIGFPEHNLQVYVESVTHRWDYADGFYTDAVVSSPAELKPDTKSKRPGFALAGNVNTVAGGNLG